MPKELKENLYKLITIILFSLQLRTATEPARTCVGRGTHSDDVSSSDTQTAEGKVSYKNSFWNDGVTETEDPWSSVEIVL